MIVRSGLHLGNILFALRGSILLSISGRLVVMLLASLTAVLVARSRPEWVDGLGAMPFTLIGLSISIFMSFRNGASYDRWWEGRKLWGQFLIASRSFARQTALIEPAERVPMLRGLCAVAAGLAARLRDEDEGAAIFARIGDGPFLHTPNSTDAVLASIGKACAQLRQQGRIDPIHYATLERQLDEIAHVQGGCERIKSTPLPFAYSLLLHRTVYLFCLLLPFALAPTLGWWTPLLVVIVSYAFFGLDALSDELADPFRLAPNDLPLKAIVRTIERELLAAAGQDELPPVLLPEQFRLD